MIPIPKDNRIMPRLEDRTEYLYIEHAIIKQDDMSICILQGNQKIPVPAARIACIILGPGTSITHRAVCTISECKCLLIWSGENLSSYYATGFEKDRLSKNILKQIRYYSDPELHLKVVQKMYGMRFKGIKTDGMSIEQMRGMEGLRVKEIYALYAEQYGISDWNGRITKMVDFKEQDLTNQLLSIGNQFLYNIVRAAIYMLGFSPVIGFIHTGHMDSFVYDMADLYKAEYIIPAAFELAAKKAGFKDMRQKICYKMQEERFLKQISRDLNDLFCAELNAAPGLWSLHQTDPMGVNYETIL